MTRFCVHCGKTFNPTSSVNIVCPACRKNDHARNERYKRENRELIQATHKRFRLINSGKRVPKDLMQKINELKELNRTRRIAKRQDVEYNNIHGIRNDPNRKPLPPKLQQIANNRRAIRTFESKRSEVELIPYAENGVELL